MWIQKTIAGIDAVAFAPDGRHLFTADSRGWVTEWDVAARTTRLAFVTGNGVASGMFFAAGGRFLITRGRSPVIWDRAAGTHAQLDLNEPGQPQDTNPFSMTTVPGADDRLLLLRADQTRLRTWDTATRAFGSDFGAWPHDGQIRWFDVSPDGRRVALIRSGQIHGVAIADRDTGALRSLGPRRYIDRVRFSPDGTTVGAISPYGRMWFGDVSSGQHRDVEGSAVPRSHNYGPRRPFAFHPTAPLYVALDATGAPTLFDSVTGRALRTFDFALGRRAWCVAFSPDGLTCAVGGSNKRFAVFDVDL